MNLSTRTAFWLLLLLVVIPGLAGVLVFGLSALQDWSSLQMAYRHYEQTVASSADLRAVFVAESGQSVQRLNLFADGVWTLISALLAAIGVHGLCVRRAAA